LGLTSALLLLVLLELKHLFADFFLQTPQMLMNRSQYLHPGRALHCVVHVGGSAMVLLIWGVPLTLAALVLLAEGVAHYHIDWLKGVWSDKTGHVPADAGYWRAFGTDQFAHHTTYAAMVWAVA
jgi:hypothetical protein